MTYSLAALSRLRSTTHFLWNFGVVLYSNLHSSTSETEKFMQVTAHEKLISMEVKTNNESTANKTIDEQAPQHRQQSI